jgi:multidrug resistance efflux pump
VQQAEAALDRLLGAATAGQIAEAEAQVRSAQAALDLLTAGARDETIAAAQADVSEARAVLQRAEADLSNAELRAPFVGTVAAVDVSQGEMVQPGQVVLTLADLDHLQVETTDLSERDVAQVAVGQPANVFVEALDVTVTGRVERISPQATTIGGDVVYAVTVTLDEQLPGLRWGMSVDVEILSE